MSVLTTDFPAISVEVIQAQIDAAVKVERKLWKRRLRIAKEALATIEALDCSGDLWPREIASECASKALTALVRRR